MEGCVDISLPHALNSISFFCCGVGWRDVSHARMTSFVVDVIVMMGGWRDVGHTRMTSLVVEVVVMAGGRREVGHALMTSLAVEVAVVAGDGRVAGFGGWIERGMAGTGGAPQRESQRSAHYYHTI